MAKMTSSSKDEEVEDDGRPPTDQDDKAGALLQHHSSASIQFIGKEYRRRTNRWEHLSDGDDDEVQSVDLGETTATSANLHMQPPIRGGRRLDTCQGQEACPAPEPGVSPAVP